MKKNNSYLNLKIRKRAWHIWFLWLLWTIWILFWVDVTLGSLKEFENRAFIISLVITIISIISGVILWYLGYKKSKKSNH
jgi:hypothetical protein